MLIYDSKMKLHDENGWPCAKIGDGRSGGCWQLVETIVANDHWWLTGRDDHSKYPPYKFENIFVFGWLCESTGNTHQNLSEISAITHQFFFISRTVSLTSVQVWNSGTSVWASARTDVPGTGFHARTDVWDTIFVTVFRGPVPAL